MENLLKFSQELNRLRMAKNISSRELSKRIDKAPAYVSQIERGLIKKLDYEVCYRLFKELGIEEKRIEGWLYECGIISAERRQAEIELELQRLNDWESELIDSLTQNHKEATIKRLQKSNDRLHHLLEQFIHRDFKKAERLIDNLASLTRSKEDFQFLCLLFQLDLSHLSDESRSNLLMNIKQIYDSDMNWTYCDEQTIFIDDCEGDNQ